MKARLTPFTTDKIYVVLEKPEHVIELQKRLEQLEKENAELHKRLNAAETKYGYESYLSNELLDILKQEGIKVRPGLLKRT